MFAMPLFAQNIPVSFPVLEDYLRREQVMGNVNTDFSFNYKPILAKKAFPEFTSPFLLDSGDSYQPSRLRIANEKGNLKISALPIQATNIFNSGYPYGWGNGATVPARGVQTLVSAGAHIGMGALSIQLYPQFHYAQNLPFEEYPANAPRAFFVRKRRGEDGADIPVRHGQNSISQLLPGNSHIKINFGSFAAGASTENIWWGPGRYNALLISDNARAFPHFTVHTTKPAKTFMGSFEGQYFVGKLEGSGLTHFSDSAYIDIFRPKPQANWRYFTGLSISYNPKWVEGLSVGASRTFQIYREDMRNSFRSYFPLFTPLPKEGEGVDEHVGLRESQNIAVFARWVFPKAKAEIYVEYLRNDHSLNWRELVLNPEHSRGYLFGFAKYVPLEESAVLGIKAEMLQTQISVNNNIRWGFDGTPNAGLGVYDNYQVRHGLTNYGQILGVGTGTSGNLYSLEISRIKGLNKVGVLLERLAREQNLYHFANSNQVSVRPWINLVGGILIDHQVKNYIFSGRAYAVRSLNQNLFVEEPTTAPLTKSTRSLSLYADLKVAIIL